MPLKNINALYLDQIVSEFEKGTPISLETVKGWMQSEDAEVLGALMHLITDEKHYRRINPPLAPEDYRDFMMRYTEISFLENPDGEWSDSRTTAGWDFVKWFVQLWKDPAVPRSVLTGIQDWLAKLYKEGNTELRGSLVTSILKYLFERPEIAKLFVDWRNDPILEPPYTEALKLATMQSRRRDRES